MTGFRAKGRGVDVERTGTDVPVDNANGLIG